MGMESFFVLIVPEKVQNRKHVWEINSRSFSAHSYVIQNTDILDYWKDAQNSEVWTQYSQNEEHRIANHCVDVYCKQTDGGGYYLELIGCMSCFENSITCMYHVIQNIYCVLSSAQVIIGKHEVPLSSLEFELFYKMIQEVYEQKHIAFQKEISNQKNVCAPSEFWCKK